MKIGLVALLVLLVSCATSPLSRPLAAASASEFQHSMARLEVELDPADLLRFQDALGVLMVTDLEFADRSEFLRRRVDGRTPEAIIADAVSVRTRYGIPAPD